MPVKKDIASILKNRSSEIPNTLAVVWLLGFLLIFGRNIARYLRFLRTIRENSVIAACPEMGTDRITVRKTDMIDAPLMVGLFNPTLLLPISEPTREHLGYILLHELTHYRRRDLLYKWFTMFVNTVHWFNPFSYIVSNQIDRECEFSCDFSVAANMSGEEKNSYMRTILTLFSQAGRKPKLLTTAMANDKKQIMRRFTMITKSHKMNKRTAVLSVLTACVILTSTIFTSGVLANTLLNDEDVTVYKADEIIIGLTPPATQGFVAAANDATEVPVVDGSGFSRDDGTLKIGNDFSVCDTSDLPVVPVPKAPNEPQAIGQLSPGDIYTSTATYRIAEGQHITFDGTWSKATGESYDVGVYNTETGVYTWVSCADGIAANVRLRINNSAAYKIVYRNPASNIYTTNYDICFVVD
jgi:beta-lactamase regulating signal transducer with metallopeptidase domain